MKIINLVIENFKGVKNVTYNFEGKNVRVSGKNGLGKSTIMDAWCWLWFDKDSQLNSNPNIRPNTENEETLEVSVEANIDIDGKPIAVKKLQKKKVSKDGKISLTNTYEINAVPKSERDFKAYFEDLGIDFGNFLQMSHAETFTAGMNEKKTREAMRNTLFSMASDLSDLEVAAKTEDVEDLKALLTNYKLEEVIAMQNATVRKIKETYGKDGELIDSQIAGKEALRVDIDTAELELQKKLLLEKIESKKKSLTDVDAQFAEYQNLSNGIMELRFKLSDLERNANANFVTKKAEHERTVREKEIEISNKRSDLARSETKKRDAELILFAKEKLLESKKNEYKSVRAEQLNESSLICPTCGQELPTEKAESIKTNFENKKKDRLAQITVEGTDARKQVDENKAIIDKETANIAELENQIKELNVELANLKAIEIKNDSDVTSTDEYKAIETEIAEKEKALHSGNNADEIRRNITMEIDNLHYQLREVEKQIASVDINSKIDEQIAELQAKKLQLAQDKADCEKILYQIDLLNRSKNELLTEEINSHFKLVKFRLFYFQKNGEYKEDCTPMSLDGKVLGESTNTALSMLMKLDIVQGLQSFYGKNYPVFIDGAECLDTVNASNIQTDFQVIMLKVSDDEELKVEVL